MKEKGHGLKVGIEIHQQLDTKKLFCGCRSELRSDEPDVIVKRKLYAVAGETGKVDVAAAYEETKKRTYVYEGYSDFNGTCEVEFDESPPREINQEALRIALQISLLLNAKPVAVSQVMRKTVVDGSNTSGFQRTLLVARNGYVEVNGKKIGIDSVILEEDSARRISETKESVNFRLDRLGVPLVEIATFPDISDPDDAKEVALKIGEILRACKVKRGIGTIRQDVNVSITGGDRTEVKGVQDPSLIPKVVRGEIERQLQLIKEKKKVERTVRNALPDGNTKFLRPMPGASRLYPETDLPLVKISGELIKEVFSNLPKLKSEMREELIKKGLSDEYARIILSEGKEDQFEELLKTKASPSLIAKLLILFPKDIANREQKDISEVETLLNVELMGEVLKYVVSGKLQESNVREVLSEMVSGKSLEEAAKAFKPVSSSKVEDEIKKIIKEKPGLSVGGYMGLIRQKLPTVPGKEAMEILKKLLG